MARTCSVTHGFAGFTKIGSYRVLSRPGARLSMPRNLDIPYPISNQPYGPLNYAEGLRFPVLQLPAIPMDLTGVTGSPSQWFTGTQMSAWFMDRTAAPCYDLTETDVCFSDNGVINAAGVGSFLIQDCKAAGFTLRVRKGEVVSLMMRWAGTDRVLTGVVAPTPGLGGTPINYSRVRLEGGFSELGIIGMTINFDTGLTPNLELDSDVTAIGIGVREHNADLPTATVVLEHNAMAGVDCPGFNYADPNVYPEVADGELWIRYNATQAIKFTFPRLVVQDPDDKVQQAGRVIRQYTYNALATTAAYPLSMADATW